MPLLLKKINKPQAIVLCFGSLILLLPASLCSQTDWRIPGSQRAAVEGTSSYKPYEQTSNNEPRINKKQEEKNKKREEENKKIDDANKNFELAQAAAKAGDPQEAIRLAKQAQDIVNDHKWLSASIARWRFQLKYMEANKANRAGDIETAVTLYKEIMKEDPGYFNEEGKKIIHDLEVWLENEKIKNRSAADMIKDLEAMAPAKDGAVSSGDLDFTADIKSATGADSKTELERSVIKSMNELAKDLKWNPAEISRLNTALNKLSMDGDNIAVYQKIDQAWSNIREREADEEVFAKEAAAAKGKGLPGAGTQTGEQCAVFALANTAGLPYSVVATRAAELIRQGKWRSESERADPSGTITHGGLWGGEVVMLAEIFGEADIIPSKDFEKVISEGRPIMVNIIPSSGKVSSGHEVVLAKTFKHNGETFYEMIDSNEKDTWQRRYISHTELYDIIKENGIAYKPEKGQTPALLR